MHEVAVHFVADGDAMPLEFGSSWRMTESKQTLNKGAASTHPCLNPTLVPTGAESTSLRMTAEWCVWRSLMRATRFGGAPLLSKICQAISLSTESKALVRSSMHMCRVWPLSQAPLHRRRKLNRASIVLLLGLNPHCSSSRSCHAALFLLSSLCMGLQVFKMVFCDVRCSFP